MDAEPQLSGLTFGGRLTGLLTDPILQCVVYIAIVSAIFVAFPGIDVWFSNGFVDPKAGGFPSASLPALVFVRDINRSLTAIVPVALIVLLLVKLVRPERLSIVAPARTLFILATLAVGPGIITNLLFKDHWGRPRPNDVMLFGGQLPFVPAWQITSYCPGNCSFISGEASSSIWLLSLAVLVPLAWRLGFMRWMMGFVVIISLDRIAFGGHFLSDVLLGWGFTALVMIVGYRFLLERPFAWLSNSRQEARWTRLGVSLRKAVGFPTPGFGAAAAVFAGNGADEAKETADEPMAGGVAPPSAAFEREPEDGATDALPEPEPVAAEIAPPVSPREPVKSTPAIAEEPVPSAEPTVLPEPAEQPAVEPPTAEPAMPEPPAASPEAATEPETERESPPGR